MTEESKDEQETGFDCNSDESEGEDETWLRIGYGLGQSIMAF